MTTVKEIKTEEVKKVKKVLSKENKEVKIPYILTKFLADKVMLLKVPTYGDITTFKKIQEVLGAIEEELSVKTSEIIKNHVGEERLPEDTESAEYKAINKEYQELMAKDSSFSRKELQLFSKEDFSRVFPDNLSVADAMTLEYWLVK